MNIRAIIAESIRNAKVYYHGRNASRPYSGNYIYMTDNLKYAMDYSDFKHVHAYQLKVPHSSIFSINNPSHMETLRAHMDPYVFEQLELKIDGREIDWAELNNISTEREVDGEWVGQESPEDSLEELGFTGVFLNERPGVDSLLLFNQGNATLIKKLAVDSYKNYHGKMSKNFEDKFLS